MMGKKNLRQVKAQVAALLATLPGRFPRQWLDREIKAAKGQRERDVETLEMLRAALEREVRRGRKRRPPPTAAKR